MYSRIAVLVAFMLAAAAAWAEEPQTSPLPLKRVVLFSSGVGFFEHSGTVRDNAKVEMKFKTEDINDLLKSMVARDFDGGEVSTVAYGSKDPITKTLQSFSIDLTSHVTLAELLRQIRGERVIIETPRELNGLIVGVETRKKTIGENQIVEYDVLNLLTDGGLSAVPLESVGRIKLANEKLDAELRRALAILASAHATDKKSVELNFQGKGERRVRVGYVQETPVWKTTYRLVLSDNAQEKPFLQGWAIVENTSEEDWNGVRLTLVSGRPISFKMDLYEPLYVPRPEVQLELFASLRPQSYDQDMKRKDAEFAAKAKAPAFAPAAAPAPGMAMGGRSVARRANLAAEADGRAGGFAATEEKSEPMDDANLLSRQGVRSVAEAGNVGNLFQYAIAAPVTLARQQSAMLPIVNADIKGEKVSIYNAGVQPKHPLNGLRFTNATDLHLMQGPITVFDGGVYAGDAKIDDMPPGAQRLLSYGIDLDTEVASQAKSQPDELLSMKLMKGVLIASRKYVRSVEYTVKNSGKSAKTVLVEYPLDPNWTLVEPKEPAETTRNMYRFAVAAKPGEPAKLTVAQQRIERQDIALGNLDDAAIHYFISAKAIGPKVKAALEEIIKRKTELQQVFVQRQQLEQRVRQIGEDQARIRQNMPQLDRQSEVYRNYVKKFSDQEAELEKLREQNAKLLDQENVLRKSLDEYMLGLELDE
jgi:hypothetical protein